MSHTQVRTTLEPAEALMCGMGMAVTAREAPERLAIASQHGDRSFDYHKQPCC